MIQNQRQYNVTKGQIAKLEGALQLARDSSEKMDARVNAAMIAGIESQIHELREQMREYEGIQRAETLRLSSMRDLGRILIKTRIARGDTQKALADKLKMKSQQIQQYEATEYRRISLNRIIGIMEALGIDLEADIPLKPDSSAQELDCDLRGDRVRAWAAAGAASAAQQPSRFVLDNEILRDSTGVDRESFVQHVSRFSGCAVTGST